MDRVKETQVFKGLWIKKTGTQAADKQQPLEKKTRHLIVAEKTFCRNDQSGGGIGIHRESGKHTAQVLEPRPFILRANRIVTMSRGKLNVQDLLSPPDFSGATPCVLTGLIITPTSSTRLKDIRSNVGAYHFGFVFSLMHSVSGS